MLVTVLRSKGAPHDGDTQAEGELKMADPPRDWSEKKRRRFARIARRAPDIAKQVLRGELSFRRADFLALERARSGKDSTRKVTS